MNAKDVIAMLSKFHPESEVVVMGAFPQFEYREISAIREGVRPLNGITPPAVLVGSVVRDKESH